jgi:hypothetical protein
MPLGRDGAIHLTPIRSLTRCPFYANRGLGLTDPTIADRRVAEARVFGNDSAKLLVQLGILGMSSESP